MATIGDIVSFVRLWAEMTDVVLHPDSLLEEFVNTAQRNLQRVHVWRQSQTTVDLPYGPSDDGVPLPSDFFAEQLVGQVNAGTTDPSRAVTPWTKTYRELWVSAQDPTNSRDPFFTSVAGPAANISGGPFYYIFEAKLFAVPQPTADLTARLDYHAFFPDLTGTGSNVFTLAYPDVLRSGALVEAFRYLHEEERAATFAQEWASRVKEAVGFDSTINLSGQTPQRGV